MDTDLVGRGSVTLTKDVITIDGTPRIYETMKDMHNVVLKAMWELSPDVFGMLQMLQNVTEMSEATCQRKSMTERGGKRETDRGTEKQRGR